MNDERFVNDRWTNGERTLNALWTVNASERWTLNAKLWTMNGRWAHAERTVNGRWANGERTQKWESRTFQGLYVILWWGQVNTTPNQFGPHEIRPLLPPTVTWVLFSKKGFDCWMTRPLSFYNVKFSCSINLPSTQAEWLTVRPTELSPLFRNFFERKMIIKNKNFCCSRKLLMPLFKEYKRQNNTSIWML